MVEGMCGGKGFWSLGWGACVGFNFGRGARRCRVEYAVGMEWFLPSCLKEGKIGGASERRAMVSYQDR